MKRILCYGDSNTWGYIPGSGQRYPQDVRWTGVCQKILGDDYLIIEDGINGRTTCFDKGWGECKNGRTGLGYAILANYPIDAVVIMLGTNDVTEKSAAYAKSGVDELVRICLNANYIYRTESKIFLYDPKVLLVAPITLNENVDDSPVLLFRGQYEESKKFAKLYKEVAEVRNIDFLDASLYANASKIDGIHMEAQDHENLGEAIANKIKEMF